MSDAEDFFEWEEVIISRCTWPDCSWTRNIQWSDLADDGDAYLIFREHFDSEHAEPLGIQEQGDTTP